VRLIPSGSARRAARGRECPLRARTGADGGASRSVSPDGSARRLIALVALAVLSASCEHRAVPPERVPTAGDFADFLSWSRTPVPSSDVFPHAVYANALAEGGEPYALGAAFVSAEESGPHQTWFLHGMAFRGGDFNRGFATGWEFFGLYMDETSRARIIWRGDHPPLGAGYVEPDSGERSDAGPMGFEPGDCRGCHADPTPVIPY
jgi:hypothetical protein